MQIKAETIRGYGIRVLPYSIIVKNHFKLILSQSAIKQKGKTTEIPDFINILKKSIGLDLNKIYRSFQSVSRLASGFEY